MIVYFKAMLKSLYLWISAKYHHLLIIFFRFDSFFFYLAVVVIIFFILNKDIFFFTKKSLEWVPIKSVPAPQSTYWSEADVSVTFFQMQTMLLEVTATTKLRSWDTANLSIMISCRSKGTFLEFSKWSSWSSGHIKRVVGVILDLFWATVDSCANWGISYTQIEPLSSPQAIRPFPMNNKSICWNHENKIIASWFGKKIAHKYFVMKKNS